MLINTLLIVADRGGLRAYRVDENPGRAPGLHPIDSFEAEEAHGRYQDKLTDQAGRFRASGHGNAHTGGISEQHTLDTENARRACKHVAERINELVDKEKPEGWRLAVPAQIAALVTDHLKSEVRAHLTETVHANLLHVEPSKLLEHFSALHTA